MTSEAIDALGSVFGNLWRLLGSIQIPGTFLTGQHLLVAPFGAVVFITALKKILDIGGVSSSSLGGVSQWARKRQKVEDD